MKIKDIAEAFNFSVSTVSKALNGAFDVSKETKELVLEYAKANGYKSRDERLTVKKVRRLCYIYDYIGAQSQNNIIMPLSQAFAKYARESNFEVIQTPVEMIKTNYDKYMKMNNFDGAFIAGLNAKSPLLEELKNTDIPTVLYDNVLVGDKIATINNESINTICKIVTMLYKAGHRKIGFIHGDKNSFVSNERFAGYITGQVMNGLSYEPKYVYFGKFSEHSGYEAADYFINTDVTAIVCASDVIAIGLMKGLEKNGVSVPKDISVTGYDDLDISRYVKPSLTTVKQDLDLIGEKALSTLLSMMMNRSSQRIVINGEIKVRESTSIAKTKLKEEKNN